MLVLGCRPLKALELTMLHASMHLSAHCLNDGDHRWVQLQNEASILGSRWNWSRNEAGTRSPLLSLCPCLRWRGEETKGCEESLARKFAMVERTRRSVHGVSPSRRRLYSYSTDGVGFHVLVEVSPLTCHDELPWRCSCYCVSCRY